MTEQVNIHTIRLNNGRYQPLVALGTYGTYGNVEQGQELIDAIKTAIKIGYRHFDTAWFYQNENLVGQAVREAIQEANGALKREDLFITSKVWNTHHSKERVRVCLNETLANLGLDYVDLYLLHWPLGLEEGSDPYPVDENGVGRFSDVHYLETYKAVEELYKEGKVKSIGVSNFNIQQLQDVLDNCEIKPVNNQIEINLYLQQHELVDFCQKNDIVLSAYAPLGATSANVVFDNNQNGVTPLLQNEKVVELAKKYGKSAGQIILRWLVQRNVVVLPKSVNEKRLRDNADIFNFSIDEKDMNDLKSLDKNYRIYAFAKEWGASKFYPF